MNVSYDYYRVFYYVAKYKSFSRAARILSGHQPNITKMMNKLEQQLNCRLFTRSNRGIALTAEGEQLFLHISAAFEQIEQAERELERDTALETGIVSIGVSEMALHGLLLSILEEYHKEHPKVRIRLSNYNSPQAVQALKQGKVDFCVITAPVTLPAGFRLTALRSYREIPVSGTAAGNWGEFTLSDLAEEPLIALGEGTGTYGFYTDLFGAEGLRYEPDIQAATADQLLSLAEHNLGIAFVPAFMAEPGIQAGRVVPVPLKQAIPERKICLLEEREKTISFAARELKKCILNSASV